MRLMNVNEFGSDTVIRYKLLRTGVSVSTLDAVKARKTLVIAALERMSYRHVIVNCISPARGMDIALAILKWFPEQSVVLISSKHSDDSIFPTLAVIPDARHLNTVFAS